MINRWLVEADFFSNLCRILLKTLKVKTYQKETVGIVGPLLKISTIQW